MKMAKREEKKTTVYKNIIVTSVNINNDAKIHKVFAPNAMHNTIERAKKKMYGNAISTISSVQSMWEK